MGSIIPLKTVTENPPRIVPKPNGQIRIGQIQLNTSFSGQYYFPFAAGLIQAYAKRHFPYPDDLEFKEIIYKFPKNRREIDEICEKLSECDILGVGNYTWGEQHSLVLGQEYKKRNPNGILVFGGPQVPDSKKQFRLNRTTELTAEEQKRQRINFTPDYHRAHPEIDICVHGEGERVFTKILEQMAIDGCYNKRLIPSISYTDANGNFCYNNKLERMKNNELAEVPSPFTTGVFDKLIEENPDQVFITMYETNRGCPFSCTYCDWGGATEDRVSEFPMTQIYNDIMWCGQHKVPYWFICDANWGIKERDEQIAEFFAESKVKYGYPEAVSTQNSKNPKAHTIRALKALERAGLNKATVMSQQSLNPPTLKAVRRDNMKLEQYYEIQKELAAQRIFTMTDLIPGMPEETFDTFFDGIATLITNGQHNRIQFNILSILCNTEMADWEYQERYGFKTVKTKIINAHGSKNDSDTGIDELQEFVIGTNTMPPEDWVKTYILCWTVNLFYFSKLLQIPIIILHEVYGFSYRQILELFSFDQFSKYGNFPVLSEINRFFSQTGRDIQAGKQGEFIYSEEWLKIYWMPDEHILIKLCREGKLEDFYKEAGQLLRYLAMSNSEVPIEILEESINLNRHLLKIPFQAEDISIRLSYNTWGIYRSVLVGQKIPLAHEPQEFTIDRRSQTWPTWEDWYQKMVWYSNRRGAYLYNGNKNPHQEIAGHH